MIACRLFCLLTLVWIMGCGKKEESAAPPSKPQAETPAPAMANPEVPNPPEPSSPSKHALELTPELESAVLHVRVAMAASLQQDHVGILLNPGTFTPPIPADSSQRLIAVLLPTCEESALRSPSCLIWVMRKKLDSKGGPCAMLSKGTLVHFDAATHAAIVQFTEDFEYRLEEGLSPGASTGDLYLLQSTCSAQVPAAMLEPQVAVPRITLKPGRELPGLIDVSLRPTSVKNGVLTPTVAAPPGAGAEMLKSAPVLTSDGSLAGFVSYSPGQSWEFRSFAMPAAVALAPPPPTGLYFIPQIVQLSSSDEGYFNVILLGEFQDPLDEMQECEISIQNLPRADFKRAASPFEDQPPVAHEGNPIYTAISQRKIYFKLKIPEKGVVASQLVQAQIKKKDGKAAFHCAPFLITSTLRDTGLYQSVAGLQGQDDDSPLTLTAAAPPVPHLAAAPAMPNASSGGMRGPPAPGGFPGSRFPGQRGRPGSPGMPGSGMANRGSGMRGGFMPGTRTPRAAVVDATSKELTTESRILYGVPLCEGREVLFRLDGPPYYKRLSLAEGRWLPLPAEDLHLCHIAANKDALFVLHPEKREIKRYNAATLALEKSAPLPDGISYQGLAAGCLSDDAPVAVMAGGRALPCDPKQLTMSAFIKQQVKVSAEPPEHLYPLASGDGTTVWSCPSQDNDSSQLSCFHYLVPLHGFSKQSLFSDGVAFNAGSRPTVSATCPWDRDGIHYPGSPQKSLRSSLAGAAGVAVAPLASTPNYFVVSPGAVAASGSAGPPQCTFFSNYSEEPWATVDLPELTDVPTHTMNSFKIFASRLWLDPVSLTFALWHHDQSITLHTLDKSKIPPPPTPVLLNYPDCFVPRGGDFHFTPLLLGGTAQFSVSRTPAGFTHGEGGTLSWHVPPAAAPRQVEFVMKIVDSQEPQHTSSFKVALQLGGEQPVVAMLPSSNGESAERTLDRATQGEAVGPLVPLKSRIHVSDHPIINVLPGLVDYLALKLENHTLALFSVKDWKVMGSQPLPDTSRAFMAGDAVFVYSIITRELTRHALPGFAVTHRYQMPGTARLVGLGVGETTTGPLTLVIDEEQQASVLILDKQTLTPANWAPFTPKNQPFLQTVRLSGLLQYERPRQIRTSSDGRMVALREAVLLISPSKTTDFVNSAPSPEPSGEPQPFHQTPEPVADRVFSVGHRFSNGFDFRNKLGDFDSCEISHCGNFFSCPNTKKNSREINLYATDDAHPLLRLGGVDLLRFDDGTKGDERRLVVPMGEKNLIAVLSSGGNLLQVIGLDFAAACKAVNPDAVYVTSRPSPLVPESRVLEYQLTFNNPGAVSSYELRDPVPGASINNLGRFTYRALDKVDSPIQLNIAIQIRLKSGEVLVHKFPIYVPALRATVGA